MTIAIGEAIRSRVHGSRYGRRVQHWLHRKRQPQLPVKPDLGSDEVFGHNPDHSEAETIQRDLPPDNGWVGGKARSPEVLAKYDNRRLGVCIDKNTSRESAHAEQVEVVLRDVFALDELRLASLCEAEFGRTSECRHPVKTLCLISIV